MFRTREELNRFIMKHTGSAGGWNKLDKFKNALNQAGIDFDEETLVLIRNDTSAGNVDIQFDPRPENDQLIIDVTRKNRGATGPSVMQYFAYTVR